MYQSTRHEEELRDKFGTVTDPGDVRRKRAIEAVLNRNKATGKLEQEHVSRRFATCGAARQCFTTLTTVRCECESHR